MRTGASFGEACRYCGSTTIIVAPPSSAGQCAVYSPQAIAWAERLKQAAWRRQEMARITQLMSAARANVAARTQRRALRRAAVARVAIQARNAVANLAREAQFRSGRTSQA